MAGYESGRTGDQTKILLNKIDYHGLYKGAAVLNNDTTAIISRGSVVIGATGSDCGVTDSLGASEGNKQFIIITQPSGITSLLELGDDSSDVVTKTGIQTITGSKTFNDTISINKSSGVALSIAKDISTPPMHITYNKITTGAMGAGNIDIVLGGGGRLMYTEATYGVKVPDNSSWTADKTIATTDEIPNDSNLVHKTGNETIDGDKTFNSFIVNRGTTTGSCIYAQGGLNTTQDVIYSAFNGGSAKISVINMGTGTGGIAYQFWMGGNPIKQYTATITMPHKTGTLAVYEGNLPYVQFNPSDNVLDTIHEYDIASKPIYFYYTGTLYTGKLSDHGGNALGFDFESVGLSTPYVYSGTIDSATSTVFSDLFNSSYQTEIAKKSDCGTKLYKHVFQYINRSSANLGLYIRLMSTVSDPITNYSDLYDVIFNSPYLVSCFAYDGTESTNFYQVVSIRADFGNLYLIVNGVIRETINTTTETGTLTDNVTPL